MDLSESQANLAEGDKKAFESSDPRKNFNYPLVKVNILISTKFLSYYNC